MPFTSAVDSLYLVYIQWINRKTNEGQNNSKYLIVCTMCIQSVSPFIISDVCNLVPVSAGCGQAMWHSPAAGLHWRDPGGATVAAAGQTGDGESQNAGPEGPRPFHPQSWQLRRILMNTALFSWASFWEVCLLSLRDYGCVSFLWVQDRIVLRPIYCTVHAFRLNHLERKNHDSCFKFCRSWR